MLHRSEEKSFSPTGLEVEYTFAGWRLDVMQHALRCPEGRVVSLSKGDFQLLRVFIERPQQILTRDQLLVLARAQLGQVLDRATDVQVSRLRRRLAGGDPKAPKLIRTLRGRGYIFTPDVTFTAKVV
ncbi:MAG: winged helix-turn-helix domain-containing protein [Caulobacteraceae bacterium]